MVVNSDGINQNVGLFDHRPDLALGVAAVVVATIGDNQQRFLRILGLPHLAYAEINGIEQRRAAFRDRIDKAALNVIDGSGEVGEFLWLVGEGNEEEFILRVRGLEELDDGLTATLELAAHAAAHIKDDAQ